MSEINRVPAFLQTVLGKDVKVESNHSASQSVLTFNPSKVDTRLRYLVNNSLQNPKGDVSVKLTFSPAELGTDPKKAPPTLTLSDEQIERKLFEKYGLNLETAKRLLKTDNPFSKVETTGNNVFKYNSETGKYEATFLVKRNLHQQLLGKAEEVKKQIADEEKAKMAQLVKDAQIIPTGLIPRKTTDLIPFFVKVPAGTTADDKDKILSSFIDKEYAERIPFAQNRENILALAQRNGVEIVNVKIENGVARFEMTVENRLKLQTAFINERESINRAEAAYENFANNNELSSFLRGMVTGAKNSIEGMVGLVTDLPGTLNGLYQVVSHPIDAFNSLYKELGDTWEEFKNANPSKKSEMIGELVGSTVTEILLGKGIGKGLSILAKTKTGTALIEKAKKLKMDTAAKVAEKFSDKAANLASQRIKKSLQNPSLYSGFAGADLLNDYAIVAGNRIIRGALKFDDFAKKMVEEFGERVKPHLVKLYRDQMVELNLAGKIDEIGIKSTNLDNFKPNPDAILDPPKAKRNSRLAGKSHAKTGVPYNRLGYPIFDSLKDVTLPKELRGKGVSDAEQFRYATRQLKAEIAQNPSRARSFTEKQLEDIRNEEPYIDGLTWHHHQDGVRLQLVVRETHQKSGHDGGRKNTGGRPN